MFDEPALVLCCYITAKFGEKYILFKHFDVHVWHNWKKHFIG